LLPFSAIIARRAEQASRPAAPRPQVFTTSRQRRRPRQLAGLFHPAGTPRVSGLQRTRPDRSGAVFQSRAPSPSSRPSWFPSVSIVRFPTARPPRHYAGDDPTDTAPDRL
jgi:hypothetical protein